MKHFSLFAAAIAACTESGSSPTDRFTASFTAQDYQDLPARLADLQAARARHPDDARTVLVLGLANLWGVAESARDPSVGPHLPTYAMDALTYLGQAAQLDPSDLRIDGWLGSSLVGTGRFAHDDGMVAQGEQLVNAGVAGDPEFNLFVRALVHQDAPASTPVFASAIDDYYANVLVCFGRVARENPDVTPFVAQATTTGDKRVCWDVPKAPHNFEGFFLWMGDALVKAGQVDAARVAYQDATLGTGYTTWPFRDLLAQRLADADARAALYADADPSNDPPLTGDTQIQCAGCHATH
jgi:hypothetical protein